MGSNIESPVISSVSMISTFTCLYCNRLKPFEESSLEHAIPQFLGGAQAPNQYRLRNVCKSCNNTLGLHVDASFARSWNVTNALAMGARELYTGPGKGALPLVCIGPGNMPELNLPQGMVAELWVGPSGENIVWIRHDNESMYWYAGGNPIDKKNKLSTVYFLPTTNDEEGFRVGLEAFREAFKKAKVRRIFGVPLVGVPGGTIFPGFDAPTDEECATLQIIRKYTSQAGGVNVRTSWNLDFDLRFICKMVWRLAIHCSERCF